ncbi:glycosyltransferase family 2 protein [Streptomyces sp. NPDC014864]|uniref:glycosyltransferase family 2 protein n=1 Tax=Streptomyces sp. NPDC014864 TaxID=3364924 RepID=UPI003700A516
MHSVLIAVPTLGRRPVGPLLTELARQAAQVRPSGRAVEIVLLDNSAGGSVTARRTAAAHDAHYRRVPRRGYAQVRNAALDMAEEHEALVFIDDDEIPLQGWLEALLKGADRYGADVVWGPVRAVVPPGSPRWAAGGSTLRRQCPRPDGPLCRGVAGSGNTLLRTSAVQRTGLRFEEQFDLSGAEDTVFFSKMARAGARVVWIGSARVVETQDPDRLTLAGLLRRGYRRGAASAWAQQALEQGWGPRLVVRRSARMARGVVRIIGGSAVFRPVTVALGAEDMAFVSGWGAAVIRALFRACRRPPTTGAAPLSERVPFQQ